MLQTERQLHSAVCLFYLFSHCTRRSLWPEFHAGFYRALAIFLRFSRSRALVTALMLPYLNRSLSYSLRRPSARISVNMTS